MPVADEVKEVGFLLKDATYFGTPELDTLFLDQHVSNLSDSAGKGSLYHSCGSHLLYNTSSNLTSSPYRQKNATLNAYQVLRSML